MNNNQTNLWNTLSRILTGLAGLITSITSIIVVLKINTKPHNISQETVFICGIHKDTTEDQILDKSPLSLWVRKLE